MKVCARCGFVDWTPEKKCKSCGKEFSQSNAMHTPADEDKLNNSGPRPQSDEMGNYFDWEGS